MGLFDRFKKGKQTDGIPEEEIHEDNDYGLDEGPRRYEDFVREDEEPEEENPTAGTGERDPFDDDADMGNPFAGAAQEIDTTPQERESRTGRRLKGGLLAAIVGVIAVATVGYTMYNFMKPKDGPIIKRGTVTVEQEAAQIGATPGGALPNSYSDLAKYEEEQKRMAREQAIRSGKLNPAKENQERVLAKQKAEREAKERAEAAKNGSALGGTTTSKATADNPYPNRKIVSMNPPARPSMPADMDDDDDKGTGTRRSNRRRENPYSSPVGFNVTESGKVSNGAANAIFTALPGTSQATGKKYKLHAGTVVPVTLITGLTSDSQSAGATTQVRQDVYDSLTGTHLLIPQGAKVVGTAGAAKGRRMSVTFNRIILPNGASIKLTGSQSADGQGYNGLRDKYDEKWGPTIKGALFAGLFTGLADWIGDIDTKETSGGGLAQSAQGRVAEKVSDRLEDKADAIDKMEQPAVIIRPGYQFHVFLTDDIEIYQYQPLKGEPR